MPPATANARVPDAPDLLQAYIDSATVRGHANRSFLQAARAFFARWPDPQAWAREPLEIRLAAGSCQWSLLNFLMFWGHLQPGYDYLVERKLTALWREMPLGPWGDELGRYQAAAHALGYGRRTCSGTASQVAARLLIQTGRPLTALTDQDFAEFEQAIAERERRHGRAYKHYRNALYAARTVIYHLGSGVEPALKASTQWRWSWERHLEGVPDPLRETFVRCLECCVGTHTRSTVSHMATRLAHFGRLIARLEPDLTSLADLDRQRHIEPFLHDVAAARHRFIGAPLSASERRDRIW